MRKKPKVDPINSPEEIPGISTGSREYVSPDEAARRRNIVRRFILANIPRDVARLALRDQEGIDLTEGAFTKLWRETVAKIRAEDEDLGDDRKAIWLAQVKEEAARAAAANQFSAAAKLRELQMKGEGHEQPRRIEVNVSGQLQSSVLTILGVMTEDRIRELIDDRARNLGIVSPVRRIVESPVRELGDGAA